MTRQTPFIILLACSALAHAAALDDWIGASAQGDAVVCKRELGGEYFFLATNGLQAKVGTRLDMTGARGAHKLSVAWRITDEQGNSLVAKIPPVPLRNAYVRDGGSTFAEDVQVETLTGPASRTLRAVVEVKKCPGDSCSSADKDSAFYTVDVCGRR